MSKQYNTRSTGKGKGKAKAAPRRKTSNSTDEEEVERKAELLVPDRKKAASKKTTKATGKGKAEPDPNAFGSPRSIAANRSNAASILDRDQATLLDNIEGPLVDGRDNLKGRHAVPKFLERIAEIGRSDIVGNYTSKQRKKVEDKVRNWLKLTDQEYLQVLEHFKVTPRQFRDNQDPSEPPTKKLPSEIKAVDWETYRDQDSILTDDESTQPSTTTKTMSKTTKKKNEAGEEEEKVVTYPHYEWVGSTLVGMLLLFFFLSLLLL